MRTVLRKLGFLKYVCLLMVLFMLSVSFMTKNLFNFSVNAQSDVTSTIFLPFIVSSSTDAQGLQVADTSQTSNEPWPTYTSAKGGYSLTYPTGWTVEEIQKGSLSLLAPTGKVQDKITVTHLDFEKPEADDLAQWAKAFFALSLGPDLERTLSSISLAVEWPSGTSQQLYVQYTPPTTTEEYLITHGRLVMQIYTNSSSEGFRDLLRTVANSVKFTANSPINQEQLSAPEQPPTYLTIEEWEQRLADQIAAADAVRYRLQTGEVPTHLLEKMSERAKKEYEQMLINDAEYIEQIDQQCENAVETTPNDRAITPEPTKVVTAQAVSPLEPVSSEQPWTVYQDTNSQRVKLMFEIQYSPAKWRHTTGEPFGSVLIHLEIPSCFLMLADANSGPFAESREIQLASRDWLVSNSLAGDFVYRTADFRFQVAVTGDPTPATKAACQKAAEEVLRTFKPLAE